MDPEHGVHREDEAALEGTSPVPPHVVDRQPHRVGEVSPEVQRLPGRLLVERVGETELIDNGRHLLGCRIEHLVRGDSGTEPGHERLVVAHDERVELALIIRERAADRPHAGYVARVVAVVGGVVHEDQLPVLQLGVVSVVVAEVRVRARRGDGAVTLALRAVDPVDVVGRGVELVLVEAGLRGAHRLHDPHAGQLARPPDQLHLAGRLVEPHGVHDGREVGDGELREALAKLGDESALAGSPAVPGVGDVLGVADEVLVAALCAPLGGTHERMDGRRRGAEGKAVELAGELIDGEDVIHPARLFGLVHVLGGEHPPLAAFLPRIAAGKEQQRPPVPAVNHQVGVRDFDSGQVVELVRLAEHDEAGSGRGALHDRDGVVADRFHHAGPAFNELLGRKVLLDLGVILGAGAGGNQTDQKRKREPAHGGAS